MNKYLTFFLLLSAVFSIYASPRKIPETSEDALYRLDKVVATSDLYFSRHQEIIDSLKSNSPVTADDFLEIAGTYRKFCVDSALVYYSRALDMACRDGDAIAACRATLLHSSLLPVNGYIPEAIQEFESLDLELIPSDLLADYYEAGNQLYFYASAAYSDINTRRAFAAKGMEMTDSLLKVLPGGSVKHLIYKAEKHFFDGNNTEAIADLSEVLDSAAIEDNLFALAATMAAHYYDQTSGSDESKIRFLALAAISDILGSTRETTALQTLGRLLYERGDTERAYRYLNLALDSSIKSGSRIRIVDCAGSIPMIAKAMKRRYDRRNELLLVLIIVLCSALAVIGFLMWKMYKNHKRLAHAKEDLSDSIAIRDEYLRHILTLCSECMNRLDDFNRIAARKIKANQTSELYELLQSHKLVHEQALKFLEVFDQTFLSMYPNFVAEINSLLDEDKQVQAPGSKSLSPELRILAFMRLGIDDASAIAKFLDLSVNTVYTYRNKMKNRARDRENFEDFIKNPAKST